MVRTEKKGFILNGNTLKQIQFNKHLNTIPLTQATTLEQSTHITKVCLTFEPRNVHKVM